MSSEPCQLFAGVYSRGRQYKSLDLQVDRSQDKRMFMCAVDNGRVRLLVGVMTYNIQNTKKTNDCFA